MKLFVLLSRVPYPLDKGDKLRAYHQLRELSKEFEVKVVALDDAQTSEKDIKRLRSEFDIEVIQLNKFVIYLNLFAALFSDKPYQVHYFFQRKAFRQIRSIIKEFNPDHIYCQLLRTAEYVKNIHDIPKTIDYMDAFSKGMDRRISGAKGIRKSFIRAEANRLLKYENLLFEYFENKTIISEQDRSLVYHSERHEIEIVPNGVDFNFFSEKQVPKTTDVVFTGNMNYPPNVDGAIFLVKEIMPLVWRSNPDVWVTIAGATPAQQVQDLQSDKVNITGWVDDIRDSYASAKVFIAPMRIGTGLQNKLLEAMAMKLPCITTELANNALGAENEKNIMVGTGAESLSALILKLMNDSNLAESIALNGRQFVEQNYSWNAATSILVTKIRI